MSDTKKRFRRGDDTSSTVSFSELGKNVTSQSAMARSLLRLRVSEESSKGQGSEEDQKDRIDHRKLTSLGSIIADNINASTNLRKITPYIRKAEIIWKTLLLTPNGKRQDILQYDTASSRYKNVKLHEGLLKVIKEYYTNDYKIERELPEIVKELLVGSGSYIKLNITRPALDNLINGGQLREGVESFEDFTQRLKDHLNADFVQSNGKLVAKNLGFVKSKSANQSGVTGIENLFVSIPSTENKPNLEFSIIDEKFGITVTDNLSCLSIKTLNKLLLDKQQLITGTESLSGVVRRRLEKESDKSNGTKTKRLTAAQQEAIQLMEEKQGKRNFQVKRTESLRKPQVYSNRPYGTSLRFNCPSECCIPLYANGDNENPIAGYFLIDENGEFIRMTKDYQFYKSGTVNRTDRTTGGTTNQIIEQLAKIQNGADCEFDMHEFSFLVKTMLEKELTQSIVSGVSGSQISVDLEEEVLKIFLARAFQQKRTRVLFVPECYFTYMAFQKNSYGIGESLTNEAKEFIARLAALDVADAIAQLDNAQTINELIIGLEAQDTDPDSSIAMARAAWFKNNPTIHSLISTNAISTPVLVDALREQSLIVRVEANDNKFTAAPQISMNQIERTGFKQIDDSSRQHILNSIANFLGLPRSWLDEQDDNSNNFQIEALAEQEMLQNQTILYQNKLAEMLSDMIRKDIMVNEVVMNRLIDVIEEAEKKLLTPDNGSAIEGTEEDKALIILEDFIQNLYVSLPPPTTIERVNKLKDKMDAANEWAEKVVEMSASKGLIDPILKHLGVDEEKLSGEELTSQFKSLILYKAYKLFNIPTPFDDIVNKGKEGGVYSLLNDLDYYNENLGQFLVDYMKQNTKRMEAIKKKLPKDMLNEFEGGDDTDPLGGGEGGLESDTDGTEDTNPTDDEFLEEPMEDDLEGDVDETEETDEAETDPAETELDDEPTEVDDVQDDETPEEEEPDPDDEEEEEDKK